MSNFIYFQLNHVFLSENVSQQPMRLDLGIFWCLILPPPITLHFAGTFPQRLRRDTPRAYASWLYKNVFAMQILCGCLLQRSRNIVRWIGRSDYAGVFVGQDMNRRSLCSWKTCEVRVNEALGMNVKSRSWVAIIRFLLMEYAGCWNWSHTRL